MRCAVEFDDQLAFAATKIREIGADRFLTGEFMFAKRAVAQRLPEHRFGGGFISPQRAGALGCLYVSATHECRPSPQPSPRRTGRGGLRWRTQRCCAMPIV